MPDLASVFAFPQILFLQYAQKIFLASHVAQSFPAYLNELDIKSFANYPTDMVFFYCSQIFFENANHAKDKKGRSTSSHKFPGRIIYQLKSKL